MKTELSIGDLFKQSFNWTKTNSSLIFPYSLFLYLLAFLLTYFLKTTTSTASGILYFLVTVNVFAIYKLQTEGQIVTFKSLFLFNKSATPTPLSTLSSRITKAFWPTAVLYALFTTLLSLLLVIPGIIFAIYWQFALFIAVDQGIFGRNALKESKRLIKGHWWKVFFVCILNILISFGVSFIVALLTSFIPFLSALSSALVMALTTPFFAVVLAILYKNLKEINSPIVSQPTPPVLPTPLENPT